MSNDADEVERRLMDMLAGWSQFKFEEMEYHDPPLEYGEEPHRRRSEEEMALVEAEADATHDLYQSVANLNGGEPPTIEQMETFIKDKVVPFIMNGIE